jgi:SAM-dependent methyltransferase
MSEQAEHGFPRHFIALVRCVHDGGELALEPGFTATARSNAVRSGHLGCVVCATRYAIEGGILNLLDAQTLDAQCAAEQRSRDLEGATVDPVLDASDQAHQDMEMLPTLAALPIRRGQTMLEVGCGEGRYTLKLASQAPILAIDFSVCLLRKLQARLPADAVDVGLVACDVTQLKVARSSFDVVFSTLTSNLPTRAHRESLYLLARQALSAQGRFVFSSHHHGLRQRLAREAKSGHYKTGGIYRYNFHVGESKAELAPHFGMVDARPIRVVLPLARTLKLPVVALSRWLERIPLLNRFGGLVLGVALKPRPMTAEAQTAASPMAGALDKWRNRALQALLSGHLALSEWGEIACMTCMT